MKRYILPGILTMMSFASFGQWTSDTNLNTLAAASVTGDMQSIGTYDGRTYIAFWHDVPDPQFYQMRLQLLDKNGNQLFGPEGMLVDSTVAMSSFTTTWSLSVDRDNNLYIGFNGTGGNTPAIVHKISPAGVQLWGNSGVQVGSGYDVKILPLSTGEAVVTWLPGNKGAIQKFTAAGTPVWANPVTIEPSVATHKSSGGELAEMSNGDFLVIFHDRNGFSPSSLPYAQRYTTNGVPVWASPVALSNTYYTTNFTRYPIKQDGDVVYFGYAGFQGSTPSGFLQRINPDGSLPWGINGSDFSTQSALYERDVKIAFSQGSDVVWAICEYSDVAQGQVGEYVQKFDKTTGARLLTNAAKELYPVSAAYISHASNLELINDQPIFLISNGSSNGVFPIDLLAVYLDKLGNFAWSGNTRPISTNSTGVKSRIHINALYNGGFTSAWAEVRNNDVSKPFAQNLQVAVSAVVNLEEKYHARLSPNPNKGVFHLELELPQAMQLSYRIFASNGQLMKHEKANLVSGKQDIPMAENLPDGAYFLQIQLNDIIGTIPFVVNRQ